APAPAPRPAPAPEPVGDPNLPQQPAFETIDIMLKSNLEVKKCFYGLLKAEGSLPSRVEVRLSIYPSGAVKSVGVKDTRYAGTEFDSCLASSIKNITFPPSNRGGTFTYPFILQ
ncbi:MAG: AgmX/PglI C-terminal domain-containing protein, partial [Proteobacteria bacterium]|nr:AgmX/PglI C-terminal domain-containing protein [Pseudomonadota bacterium]